MSPSIRRAVATLVLAASAAGLFGAEIAHAGDRYKVNTSGTALTVRSGPGTNYRAVGSVPDGGSVEINCQTTTNTSPAPTGAATSGTRSHPANWFPTVTCSPVTIASSGPPAPPPASKTTTLTAGRPAAQTIGGSSRVNAPPSLRGA